MNNCISDRPKVRKVLDELMVSNWDILLRYIGQKNFLKKGMSVKFADVDLSNSSFASIEFARVEIKGLQIQQKPSYPDVILHVIVITCFIKFI